MAVVGEWRRDWAHEETVAGRPDVVLQHCGASDMAFAGEIQPLAARAAAAVSAAHVLTAS
ncbi:hypothetical protein [Arenibaculum pallidiluteum]|uniref:hypothetical protein n=1 Tax=Arenibaculum pallidiluteum TaxID=2812559 RepID=UPI001A961CCC|nr:hypothetical protein [Arenibaculum pallidiluteum]